MPHPSDNVTQRLTSYGERLLGLIPAEKIRTLDAPRADKAILNRFSKIPDLTSTVADILDSFGLDTIIPASVLRPIDDGQLVGSAVTVRYVKASMNSGYSIATKQKTPSLGGRDIVTLSQAGDVLVIESSADSAASSFGGIMATAIKEAGMEGVIVDGNIRDVANLRKLGLHAWARGITPRTGKHRLTLAEFNGTVELAGIPVSPGDIILGDTDGIVIVPVSLAEQILERAEQAVATENVLIDALQSGATPQDIAKILSPERW